MARWTNGGAAARRFALFFAAWLVLTGASVSGLGFGLAASALAAAASLKLSPQAVRLRLLPLLALAPRFVARSLAGGWDVAWRALHPKTPLRPGWIDYSTRLPPGGPRVALSGELSLQPGTLVAGSRGDRLLVHCLDTGAPLQARIAEEEERLAASIDAAEAQRP